MQRPFAFWNAQPQADHPTSGGYCDPKSSAKTPNAQEAGSTLFFSTAKAFSPGQWPYWEGSGTKHCKSFFLSSVDNRETPFFLSSLMKCVGVKKIRIVGQRLHGTASLLQIQRGRASLKNDVTSCGQLFFLGQPKYSAGRSCVWQSKMLYEFVKKAHW